MFIVVGIMLTGILIGYLARSKKLGWIPKAITFLIWVLLFLLGLEVGNNESIIRGLHTLGIEAAVITIGAVVGSTLLAWALWAFVMKRTPQKQGDER